MILPGYSDTRDRIEHLAYLGFCWLAFGLMCVYSTVRGNH